MVSDSIHSTEMPGVNTEVCMGAGWRKGSKLSLSICAQTLVSVALEEVWGPCDTWLSMQHTSGWVKDPEMRGSFGTIHYAAWSSFGSLYFLF